MKFSLTKNKKVEFGITFYQIKAEEDGKFAKKGELGGWLEKKENLDMSGNAWVYGNARVYGNAWVSDDAKVSGNARVYGNAWVSDNAKVFEDAWVSGNAKVTGDAKVSGNAWVYGNSMVYGNAWVHGNSMVYGNAWVYGDSVVSGNAKVTGDARVSGKLKLTLGYFFGMRYNNEEIKEFKQKDGEVILHKGDSEIEFYDDEVKEEIEDDIITLNGKKYKLVDNK